MTDGATRLRNFARGRRSFHAHRLEIIRDVLDGQIADATLSPFLRDQLYKINLDTFGLFAFGQKDWSLCARLLTRSDGGTADVMTGMVADYVIANQESVARLYALNRVISGRLLSEEAVELAPETDVLEPVDSRSLFSIRVDCAVRQASSDLLRQQLEDRFPSKSWARQRLVYPLLHYFVNRPRPSSFESFLSYMVTGREHEAEKHALKLLLSDEAARATPLPFKAYIGLMGHAYDACEIVLDHIEYQLAAGDPLNAALTDFLATVAAALPGTRAESLQALIRGKAGFVPTADAGDLSRRFPVSDKEAKHYAALCSMAPFAWSTVAETERPYAILANMRAAPYPEPIQFQRVVANHDVWFFTDGARFLGALLRSIYMVDRVERDLEIRDALRLVQSLGTVTPMVAAAPSGLVALRRLERLGALGPSLAAIEAATQSAVDALKPATDRLWILELQWALRRLEEEGRIQDWLGHVRTETKLRPAFLTGVNFNWVDEIVEQRRLGPFRSFDGAYLFLLAMLEVNADPLRLRLVLEPLIEGLDYEKAVRKVIDEFGAAAPAIIRRYLNTQNMLASGLAANYVAALDQRVQALEECIRRFGYGPLLSEEMYESEAKALTAELLLTSVNAGKFEVPWDTFRKDAFDSQNDLFLTVQSLRTYGDEDPKQSAYVETLVTFANGRSESYRYRVRQSPLFALLSAIINAYMQHPAFGLEVILSGRFRHNNLLHELWSAIAGVTNATIVSVARHDQAELVEEYKAATEQVLDDWCSVHLQSLRHDKPNAMFDLIPTQRDVDELLVAVHDADGMTRIIDLVVDWLKGRLRDQVATAQARFALDVPARVSAAFDAVRGSNEQDPTRRPQDVAKVHAAVTGAVERRVDELKTWFGGVDAVSSASVSLSELSFAVGVLFDNLLPGRKLSVQIDRAAEEVLFAPHEVKIAFDMLREIYFNALRHGGETDVALSVRQVSDAPVVTYAFSNPSSRGPDGGAPEVTRVAGSRFDGTSRALFREGSSGIAKIAAIAATLVGEDTEVERRLDDGGYQLVVPVRQGPPAALALAA